MEFGGLRPARKSTSNRSVSNLCQLNNYPSESQTAVRRAVLLSKYCELTELIAKRGGAA